MQSLLNRFFPQEKPLHNIAIMGLVGAGKATLLNRLREDKSQAPSITYTIGLNIETANIRVPSLASSSSSSSFSLQSPTSQGAGEREKQCPVRFTARTGTAGGCARFYPFVRTIMFDEGKVSALIWIFDASANEHELDWSLSELEILLGTREPFAPLMPILIFANKIDLLPDRKVPEESRAKFAKLLKGRPYAFFETCITAAPLPSSGLAEAFAWLGNVLAASTSSPTDTKSQTEKKTETKMEEMVSNMRSPAALAAKLDDWLTRADKDPITSSEELLRLFYALDLPSWDHYIHLRLAYVFLTKYGRKEGKDKIFDGFKDYIDKNGKGLHGGKSFHLTMTYFWVQMVHLGIARGTGINNLDVYGDRVAREAHSLHVKTAKETEAATEEKEKENRDDQDTAPIRNDAKDFARFLMINPYLVDGQLWADYYSKEVLMSQQAKEGLVFPDIKKLPDTL